MNEAPISDLDRGRLIDTLLRLSDQARNAMLLVDCMIEDDTMKPLPKVVPDFSLGDFFVFDRKLHPEWKD